MRDIRHFSGLTPRAALAGSARAPGRRFWSSRILKQGPSNNKPGKPPGKNARNFMKTKLRSEIQQKETKETKGLQQSRRL